MRRAIALLRRRRSLAPILSPDEAGRGWAIVLVGIALAAPALAGDLANLPTTRTDLTPKDIHKALELYAMMLNLALGVTLAIAVVLWR